MTDGAASNALGDGRVFFRDIKPYAIVDDLHQLRGPAGGVVELPHSVSWAPGGRSVDLDEPGGRGLAYRAVLAEGTVEDLEQILNRGQLIAVWPRSVKKSVTVPVGSLSTCPPIR